MICMTCRSASALAAEPEVIYQYLDGRPQEMLPGDEAALIVHRSCKGGTWCDCQHSCPVRSSAADPTLVM